MKKWIYSQMHYTIYDLYKITCVINAYVLIFNVLIEKIKTQL